MGEATLCGFPGSQGLKTGVERCSITDTLSGERSRTDGRFCAFLEKWRVLGTMGGVLRLMAHGTKDAEASFRVASPLGSAALCI